MSKKPHIPPKPPRLASRLLEWYCKPSLYEDLQGDLLEYFEKNVEKRGVAYAKLVYVVDVLKFFRVYTVRKPRLFKSTHHPAMLSNYFKTSIRSMARNRLFTAINVTGLAISISVGVLLIIFLAETSSLEAFHENNDRIYRIISHYEGEFKGKSESLEVAGASVLAGRKLNEELPGVEEVVIMRQDVSFDINNGENALPMKGCFATPSFFSVFTFPLESGDDKTALLRPNSIVLTDTAARKLFGEAEPLGKLVTLAGHQFTDSYLVTGIMPAPPASSHVQFEFLISFSTWETMEGAKERSRLLDWDNIWTNQVYILLSEKSKTENLQSEMNRIAGIENGKSKNAKILLEAQPLNKIFLGRGLLNDRSSVIEKKYVFILVGLTIIVLASACFNYTNLSVARSLRRSKEVGIRKVIGASSSHIFAQFLTEAVVLACLALVVAIGFFMVIKPAFLALPFGRAGATSLTIQPVFILYFVLLAVAVGLFAGFFPAAILSRLKTAGVLKGASTSRSFPSLNLRAVLIVAQFAVSMGFIIGATVVYRQYQYALAFDLGFSTQSILNIDLQGNHPDLLAVEVEKLPGVNSVSKSAMVLGTTRKWGDNARYKNPEDSTAFYYNCTDRNYLAQHGFTLLAGSNFPSELRKGEHEKYIIINEKMLARLDIGTPAEAIGEMITVNNSLKLQIAGVVRDFHHGTVKDEIHPFAFRQRPADFEYLNLKVNTGDLSLTLQNLESIWKEIDPVHPFEASFFDDHIQKVYAEYETLFKISGFLAVLAISISTLGLLGMVVFTTETRLKEISVRKVLGANVGNLVYMLSRNFALMFFAAALAAVPASYFLFEKLVLSEFTYRISIGIFELFAGVAFIFCIGGLTVVALTAKAARTNPAHILRNE